MIRVIVVDDHAIVRQGIRGLVSSSPDLELAGEATNGRQALDLLETTPCDVLVLDISLPRVNGIEVLRRVMQKEKPPRVLVLSMYAEEQYASRMIREGAAGYLSKERSLDDLEKAIRTVAAGGTWYPEGLMEGPPKESSAAHETLSAREYQVFMLLLQGRVNADIAAELDLVPSTVSNHIAHIKQKLGCRTVAEIVSYAHRMGLVD